MNPIAILLDAATTGPTEQLPFWADPAKWVMPLILFVVFFFLMSSSRNKRSTEKKHTDMLSQMKRGDRVMTIGGMLGTVVDVRDSEVVLKVDESTNTKIKFSRDAIKRVVVEDDSAEAK